MNIHNKRICALILTMVAVSGCQYEQANRSDYMSPAAGNAIAYNSALQIIDPWPQSAGNTQLNVPSVKYGGEPKKSKSSPAPIIIQAGGGGKQ